MLLLHWIEPVAMPAYLSRVPFSALTGIPLGPMKHLPSRDSCRGTPPGPGHNQHVCKNIVRTAIVTKRHSVCITRNSSTQVHSFSAATAAALARLHSESCIRAA